MSRVRIDFEGYEEVFRQEVNRALALYANSIEYELALIGATLTPTERRQAGIVFSLCSPQADFSKNVAVTQPIVRAVRHNARYAELAALIRFHDLGLHRNKARYLLAASDLIRAVDYVPLDWFALQEYLGIGPKVASMTIALCDEEAPVFTLDRHMVRWLLRLTGKEARSHLPFAQYRDAQQWCVENLPDCKPFVAQWAVWNMIRGFHACHLGIFGLE